MDNIIAIEKQIKTLEEELEKLKLLKKKLDTEEPEKKLARAYHSKECHWNHTDGCSYYYEEDSNKTDWEGFAHKEYLEKSKKLLATVGNNYDIALRVLQLI
jgi:heterodisulfide reductase subunit B